MKKMPHLQHPSSWSNTCHPHVVSLCSRYQLSALDSLHLHKPDHIDVFNLHMSLVWVMTTSKLKTSLDVIHLYWMVLVYFRLVVSISCFISVLNTASSNNVYLDFYFGLIFHLSITRYWFFLGFEVFTSVSLWPISQSPTAPQLNSLCA